MVGPLVDPAKARTGILEFRDMNGPAPMPKSGVMRSNKVRWAILKYLGFKCLRK